jgi:hypothetical protein
MQAPSLRPGDARSGRAGVLSGASLALASERRHQAEPGAIVAVEELLPCRSRLRAGGRTAARPMHDAHCVASPTRWSAGVYGVVPATRADRRRDDSHCGAHEREARGATRMRGSAGESSITLDYRRSAGHAHIRRIPGPIGGSRATLRKQRDLAAIRVRWRWRDPDSNRGHQDFRRGPESL